MIACADHTDEQLFTLIARGNEQAFHLFFYRYNTKVFYFILRIVNRKGQAEELTQDVFLKLWTGRSSLSSVVNPGNYLFVMARNRALDELEKLSNQNNLLQSYSTQQTKSFNNTEEQIYFHDTREMIANAVQMLPEQQRRVFYLSKEQGLSRMQIANLLQLSPNTVKNHLGVAVQSIRQYLGKIDK